MKSCLALLSFYIHKSVQESGKSLLKNEKSVCETRLFNKRLSTKQI